MEKLITGLQITLIGMGIVFIILYLISLVLDLMRPIFYKPEKQKPEQKPAGPKQPEKDDSELIAVITAAITAATGTTKQIKVTTIKRIPTTTPVWGLAARQENTR